MTVEEVKKLFEKHEGEFLKFELIGDPLHPVPDVCAFILLDKIAPQVVHGGPYAGKRHNMVANAGHDQIWLSTDINKFAENCTEDDIIYLRRCGVWFDDDVESLSMFV